MTITLQKRIHTLIRTTLDRGPAAWLVWCDPSGDWLPLLRRVAGDQRLGGFDLVEVDERTAGAFGGPVSRSQVQERLGQGDRFVLYAPVAQAELGWLYAQALHAELIYTQSLRTQLMEWGWQPRNLTMGDAEVASLARQHLQEDPAQWGGSGLQPAPDLLLGVLAGLADPSDDNRLQLDLTLQQCGLTALGDRNRDLAGWRQRCLAQLLVTQAHHVAPGLIPESHDLLVEASGRPAATGLLARWLDSLHLAQALPAAILAADRLTGLRTLAAPDELGSQAFVSQAAEEAIFVAVCDQLAQQSGRAILTQMAALTDSLDAHAQGLWGHRTAGQTGHLPWGELLRLSRAADELLQAGPDGGWQNPEQAIDWYIQDGWRMDRAGEELVRTLQVATPALVALMSPLRAAFRARWEESLMAWSSLWEAAGCPVPAHLPTTGGWLKAELARRPQPTVILMVDALRYDLAATLAEELNRREDAQRGVVTPARSPLPSITALGMGLALPLDESSVVADLADGKWKLTHTASGADLSVADKRRQWLTANLPATQILPLSGLLQGETPAPGPTCRHLVIHDALIDQLGHDRLDYQGSGSILHRYLDLIERLRDGGWLRILVVTDHGFIHWSGTDEKNTDHPADSPAYLSRRALAYAPDVALVGPRAVAPGGKWQIALPRGAASFRAYGSLGYFHGGASLQEWVIPCVAIEWPIEAKPVLVALEPIPRVLSVRPKVTLITSGDMLYPEFSIPRRVQVVGRHAQSHVILFRSQTVNAHVDRPTQQIELQAERGAVAERGTPILWEVRDARTEEPLYQTQSMLVIELTGW